jgi:hypothetical protein
MEYCSNGDVSQMIEQMVKNKNYFAEGVSFYLDVILIFIFV